MMNAYDPSCKHFDECSRMLTEGCKGCSHCKQLECICCGGLFLPFQIADSGLCVHCIDSEPSYFDPVIADDRYPFGGPL